MAIVQLQGGAEAPQAAPSLETLIQDARTLTARLEELQQLQALPALVVKLLGLLKEPWLLEDHGRNGNYHRCVACRRPTHVYGWVHSDDCAWVAVQAQAKTLRESGVLPTQKLIIHLKKS